MDIPHASRCGHRQFIISDLDEKGSTGFGLFISEDDEFELMIATGQSTESVKTGFKGARRSLKVRRKAS